MILFWSVVFIFSLALLVKGADLLLESSEKIGLSFGLSPFIVGVVIVGLGTSFPELAASIIAVMNGVTEIVVANAVGSNIANILLIIGLSVIIGGRLTVTKNLIDLDIPLLAISTALFLGVAYDGIITTSESVLLLILFVIYFLYTIFHKDEEHEFLVKSRLHAHKDGNSTLSSDKPKVGFKEYTVLVVGIIGLVIGAKYLVDAVIELSSLLNIGAGVITLAAVAFGTSLPELIVSIKAAWNNKPEVALGNIFGSNVFNLLLVVGLPGLFTELVIDEKTLTLGLPVMITATILFIISGISRRIHIYEGAMYLVIYIFFIGKLFNLL